MQELVQKIFLKILFLKVQEEKLIDIIVMNATFGLVYFRVSLLTMRFY